MPELTNGSLSDNITIVNPIAASIADLLRNNIEHLLNFLTLFKISLSIFLILQEDNSCFYSVPFVPSKNLIASSLFCHYSHCRLSLKIMDKTTNENILNFKNTEY